MSTSQPEALQESPSSPGAAPADASESQWAEAQARLRTGRNEPCPCGSSKKYKKCCLTNDETFAREAGRAQEAAAAALKQKLDRDTSSEMQVATLPETSIWPEEPPAEEVREVQFSPEIDAQLETLWESFDALEQPTTEQMNQMLDQLLELPAAATDWCELLHCFARAGHADLAGVFHRISATVAHAESDGLAFFYWAAAEEFVRHGLRHWLPEVAVGFGKLDLNSYDPDALSHVEDYLLADGFDSETLVLAEHFLPIERVDELMPYAVPDRCQLIFELRVGEAIRQAAISQAPQKLAEELLRGLEDYIPADCAQTAAEIVCGEALKSAWKRTDFDLVTGDVRHDKKVWQDCMALLGSRVRVAREAWHLEQSPPGSTLHGLNQVLNSVYDWKERRRQESKKKSSNNLLDYIRPAGMEARIARDCREMMGCNEPRARLQVRAYKILASFAARHHLVSAGDAQNTEKEILRLRELLHA